MEFIGTYWWVWLLMIMGGVVTMITSFVIAQATKNDHLAIVSYIFVILSWLSVISGKLLFILSIIVNVVLMLKD